MILTDSIHKCIWFTLTEIKWQILQFYIRSRLASNVTTGFEAMNFIFVVNLLGALSQVGMVESNNQGAPSLWNEAASFTDVSICV